MTCVPPISLIITKDVTVVHAVIKKCIVSDKKMGEKKILIKCAT